MVLIRIRFFLEMIDPEPYLRLQEFLPLGGSEDVKLLRSLNRHVVVDDFALDAGLGWFLILVRPNPIAAQN